MAGVRGSYAVVVLGMLKERTMTCAWCGKDTGNQHACVWGENETGLTVVFICMECSERPEFVEIDPLAE